MKLELKYLAPYLPYGLKFLDKTEDGKISEIINVDYNEDEGWNMRLKGWNYCAGIDHGLILPILRPLSDLTKEIYGVVHLVELAKIQCEYDIEEYKLQSNVIDGMSAFGINYLNNDDESMVFGYDTYNGFGLHIKPMNDVLFVSNQIKLYTYLFQHHFDIYGLIEKGLAIDINNIK